MIKEALTAKLEKYLGLSDTQLLNLIKKRWELPTENALNYPKNRFFMLLLYPSLILLVSIGQAAQMGTDEIMATGRWYSVNEIAEHLGITVTTLYKWLQRKELPAHKLGRLWKFKIDEIDAWVKSDKSSSTAQKQKNKFKRSAK